MTAPDVRRFAGPVTSEVSANGQPAEVETRRAWQPVDLIDVVEGRYKAPEPTVGARGDGIGLFYPGRGHVVASESEGGKTWLMLAAAVTELDRGEHVVYIDFEDEEGGVVGRLLDLGADRRAVLERFHYIKPDESILFGRNYDDLAQLIGDTRPTLAVLDGITEAMALHGLEMKDNTEIARFGKLLPRWISNQGPAVVSLDHVVKAADNRGRYAIGGVHKLNGLNGAMFTLENKEPFAIGIEGMSRIYITKDRPGQLRRHAVRGKGGIAWFADMILASDLDTGVTATLRPARARDEDDGFRPSRVMQRITRVLSEQTGGLSKNAIETMVGGDRNIVRTALELLVSEGFVSVEKQGQALIHAFVSMYVSPE
jgi:hypothetical protein